MIKKCNNWVMKIELACPYCLKVISYDEFADKIKGKKGEVIECKECKKKFKLG